MGYKAFFANQKEPFFQDQTFLAKQTVEDKDSGVRKEAVSILTDQTLLAKVAVKDKNFHVRKVAISKLTDQNLLAKVALESTDSAVWGAAVSKLTDQALLVTLILEGKIWSVRKSAFGQLSPIMLNELAKKASDPAIRLAVDLKLGQRTIFDMLATAIHRDTDLGDVLGAIALLDQEKEATSIQSLVAQACRQVIKNRIVDRIPELKQLLMIYGDWKVAEDFLNSCLTELAIAGQDWADMHGWRVYYK
jgi:hypothetical protein